MKEKLYAAIDLKSFYASVECVERGLDPLTTNLVVADISRTEKTICLAVTPSLKAHGISGRARMFEVVEQVRQVNALRREKAPGRKLAGSSWDGKELNQNPALAIDYLVAPPQMALYMRYSAKIYEIYLKYVAPEDIHVYSIDEVFLDLTPYLRVSGLTVEEYVRRMVTDVLEQTGITATAGIGTNLYLCKVAMDIVAKHIPADEHGVRLAQLDEMSYRRLLWDHRPLTDFWRVGRGYAKRLEKCGLYTMGDIARCSLGGPNDFYNEDLLYRQFGINAQLLIDHAWGWEPCTLREIKAYRPSTNSISSGQVLHCPYNWEKAKLITREMTDSLTLDLVEKGLVTDQLVLTVGYDIENLTNPEIAKTYSGPVVTDHYGRQVPKHGHGTVNLEEYTASTRTLTKAMMELYDRVADPNLLVRRITIAACRVIPEKKCRKECEQLDLFTDLEQKQRERQKLEREKCRQKAVIGIKQKYGKNAILRGMNLQEGATARQRNGQVGGHKA
ncbi:MAG: DNA methylase [Oscillospiraceae bacterium]|nr:DNA methylase [Oscillospiraceae bacterium]